MAEGVAMRLERRSDRACTALAACIRSLPSTNDTVLRQIAATANELQAPAFLEPGEWEAGLGVLGLALCRSLHQLVITVHLREIRVLHEYLGYWQRMKRLPWLLRIPPLVGTGAYIYTLPLSL
jgi:hypothetical protein